LEGISFIKPLFLVISKDTKSPFELLFRICKRAPEDHEKWAIESDKYAGRYLTGGLRRATSWNYGAAGYSTTGNLVSLVHLDCSSTRGKRCYPGCKAFITQTMALAEASYKQYYTRCMKLAGPELSDYLEYISTIYNCYVPRCIYLIRVRCACRVIFYQLYKEALIDGKSSSITVCRQM